MKYVVLIVVVLCFTIPSSIAQIITSFHCGGVNYLGSVAVDTAGNVYFSEPLNNRIRKIVRDSCIIRVVAGTGIAGYSGDGGPANLAQLDDVSGLSFDKFGNLFIADYGNNVIRKIAVGTNIITTVVGTGYGAGTGAGGFSGDGGPATSAELSNPADIDLDTAGNIYIADQANGRIRKVDINSGIITTVAGTGILMDSGDGGPALSAGIDQPMTIAVDSAGNIYIPDGTAHDIRKITVGTGIIDHYMGIGTSSYSGDGGPYTAAGLGGVYDLAFDKAGNFYLADGPHVRKIDVSTGIITTAAGGVGGGDGGLATHAPIGTAQGICLDQNFNLFIADRGATDLIREVYNCAALHPTISYTVVKDSINNTYQVYPQYPVLIDTVVWYWGDGTSSVGFQPSHTYSSSGTYNLCAVGYTYCGDTVSFCQSQFFNSPLNVISNVTGIAPYQAISADMKVYPNPANNHLYIEADNGLLEINITDVLGKVVESTVSPIANAKVEIDVKELLEGVYFVRAKTLNGNSFVKKVIVQK